MYSSPLYCIDENLNKAIPATKQVAKNIESKVNVNNSNLHLHNPNINIPGYIGTGIGMGGAVTAGI